MNNGQGGEVFSVMWICSSHTEEKFHDARPNLRLNLPISAQGLPAVILAGLSAVFMADWTELLGEGMIESRIKI